MRAKSIILLAWTLLLASCQPAEPAATTLPTPTSAPPSPTPASIRDQNLHLFDYDAQSPLDIQELDSWQEGDVSLVDLSYASPQGGRVPATLIIPDGAGLFAGIIMLHGFNDNRTAFYGFGQTHARQGAVVLLIDAPRLRPENRGRAEGMLTYTELDREEQIQLIVDLRRGIDLLTARPEVDSERLAFVGFSYGGSMGGLLAGVEDRLKAYVLVVADGGLVTHFAGLDDKGDRFYRLTEAEQSHWLAAMEPVEPIHYVGYAAPAALLYQAGLNDSAVMKDDATRFQTAGSEPKEIIWYDSGHILPRQAITDQIEWLQAYIGVDH